MSRTTGMRPESEAGAWRLPPVRGNRSFSHCFLGRSEVRIRQFSSTVLFFSGGRKFEKCRPALKLLFFDVPSKKVRRTNLKIWAKQRYLV
jgi:hypothetical protein